MRPHTPVRALARVFVAAAKERDRVLIERVGSCLQLHDCRCLLAGDSLLTGETIITRVVTESLSPEPHPLTQGNPGLFQGIVGADCKPDHAAWADATEFLRDTGACLRANVGLAWWHEDVSA
jgi:hypothetical protein